MKNKKALIMTLSLCIVMTGCKESASTETTSSGEQNISAETSLSETSTVTEPIPQIEYTDSDKTAIDWFVEDMTDSETFSDLTDYQYYARTLGLDKDYFLNPEMWEVYYNEKININKDVDEKEYYLIRLNPDRLLEIYAENNNTDIDELCESLSVNRAQLYYNWGYNPVSVDYGTKHENNTASYSEEEEKIFGAYNGESRKNVMSTHLLVIDNAENECTYQSDMTSTLKIKRRDNLRAFTEITPLYSAYSEDEKSPSFKVNGIGIRAVIPLTLPNAWYEASEADSAITAMINVSPYAYGCTDDDILDIMSYINNNETEMK